MAFPDGRAALAGIGRRWRGLRVYDLCKSVLEAEGLPPPPSSPVSSSLGHLIIRLLKRLGRGPPRSLRLSPSEESLTLQRSLRLVNSKGL